MHVNHTDYLYLEVLSSEDTLMEYLDWWSFPWFQNYHNIFLIRSPQLLDYFKQGVSMDGDVLSVPLHGLSFEYYNNNIYQKVNCEERWSIQWPKTNQMKWSPQIFDRFPCIKYYNIKILARQTIEFLDNPVGNFKYGLKYNDQLCNHTSPGIQKLWFPVSCQRGCTITRADP